MPLHSCEFTEELLEAHEAEANKLKEHYEFHKDLFVRVSNSFSSSKAVLLILNFNYLSSMALKPIIISS